MIKQCQTGLKARGPALTDAPPPSKKSRIINLQWRGIYTAMIHAGRDELVYKTAVGRQQADKNLQILSVRTYRQN